MKGKYQDAIVLAISSFICGVLPLIPVFIAWILGSILGCRVDESGMEECYLFGSNIQEFITFSFTLVFLSFLTVPIGILGFAISLILLLIARFKK
jgi:hypothetical protein